MVPLFRFAPAVQTGAVVAVLLAMALAPPAHGRLLLVPLDGNPGAALRAAVPRGAALVQAGPLPGSVVVVGDAARLGAPLRAAGVLMLAAPPGGCGAGQPGEAA